MKRSDFLVWGVTLEKKLHAFHASVYGYGTRIVGGVQVRSNARKYTCSLAAFEQS